MKTEIEKNLNEYGKILALHMLTHLFVMSAAELPPTHIFKYGLKCQGCGSSQTA